MYTRDIVVRGITSAAAEPKRRKKKPCGGGGGGLLHRDEPPSHHPRHAAAAVRTRGRAAYARGPARRIPRDDRLTLIDWSPAPTPPPLLAPAPRARPTAAASTTRSATPISLLALFRRRLGRTNGRTDRRRVYVCVHLIYIYICITNRRRRRVNTSPSVRFWNGCAIVNA